MEEIKKLGPISFRKSIDEDKKEVIEIWYYEYYIGYIYPQITHAYEFWYTAIKFIDDIPEEWDPTVAPEVHKEDKMFRAA